LVGVAALTVLMVVPVPFPKIRRGSPLRWPMAATGVAAALALVPLQFHLATGSVGYNWSYAWSVVLLVGVASYYLIGPFTVPRSVPVPPAASP
ncbi:MAG TPA: hypothetical protein VEG42_05250, partial [Thermoplasmata archaeon]|nr:hypothetical protein [Thermoplasmata archaeon]